MAVVLQLGLLAGSAQTNKYLYSGSETNITLNRPAHISSLPTALRAAAKTAAAEPR